MAGSGCAGVIHRGSPMKRQLGSTVGPVEVELDCGVAFLTCPVFHADTPNQRALCSRWTDQHSCHCCSCQVCPLLRARWRALIPPRVFDFQQERLFT